MSTARRIYCLALRAYPAPFLDEYEQEMVGRSIPLSGVDHIVVGVMAATFDLPSGVSI
jgi:hypothetical protein